MECFPVGADDYHDAVILLVGHGSTLTPESADTAFSLAQALRELQRFAGVHVAFWKVAPSIPETLASLVAPRIFVVPLFTTRGYFTDLAIPSALGLPIHNGNPVRQLQRPGGCLYYCEPLGTHPLITELLLSLAREVVQDHPFPAKPATQEMALILAGHGTTRNTASRLSLERQVSAIRALGVYAEVHGVFLEESPAIAETYLLAKAKNLVIVPFFMSDGLHAYDQIPVLLGESERAVAERRRQGKGPWRNPTERQGKRIWYANSLGSHPRLREIVLARIEEAAGEQP